ncbi:hypothetical protein TSTA_009430 [Talaromyces stipitatus ATCC 10500]|uniref:Uncharacterized protein n=1 Tax=Talaromyces stipitatus (strain ATCC 10500 / CBS 375.48 / QM 6759 / NRRL 1006) TaxID=441959 RepID=B8MFV4_TALSN|nr:uncharacterized protein TSTA_009430 [Talaromyces stipitatus ATCC 10500]EED15821.1 hypothetical protein TSTA_009430 [Talaromyces stipitatus ATCC 10500]
MSQLSRKQLDTDNHVSVETEWTRLKDVANNIETLRSLDRTSENKVKLAVATLREEPISQKRRKYKLFLCDVLKKCGPVGVLLCATVLGTNKVFDMGKTRRLAFINKLEANKIQPPLASTVLLNIALHHQIPASIEDLRKLGSHDISQKLATDENLSIQATGDTSSAQAAALLVQGQSTERETQRNGHDNHQPGTIQGFPNSLTLDHPLDREDKDGPTLLQADDLPGFQISVLANQPPQSVFDLDIIHLIGFLQRFQSVSSSPQQFTVMLGLLQGYQTNCPSLQYIQLIIPWSGALPSIDIKIDSQIGWSAKIQLSVTLAVELVNYAQDSPTAKTADGRIP